MTVLSKTRLLLIEDSENDALLIIRNLTKAFPDLCYKQVDSKNDFFELMEKEKDWDLVITDKSLPQFSGKEVIEYIRKRGLPIPIICVSGTDIDDNKNQCEDLGADAFVLKDDFEKLSTVAKELVKKDKASW